MNAPTNLTTADAVVSALTKLRNILITNPPTEPERERLREAIAAIADCLGREGVKDAGIPETVLTVDSTALGGTAGATAALTAWRKDLETALLRFDALVLPIERVLGHHRATACRFDPLAHREELTAAVDSRLAARARSTNWLFQAPDRIARLLADWPGTVERLGAFLLAKQAQARGE